MPFLFLFWWVEVNVVYLLKYFTFLHHVLKIHIANLNIMHAMKVHAILTNDCLTGDVPTKKQVHYKLILDMSNH